MNAEFRERRSGLVLPAVVTAAALLILLGLGTWQLQRKTEKEDLLARIASRVEAPPAPLPPAESWPQLDRLRDEYRRVRFNSEIAGGEEALVYTSGSSFRPDVTAPGYWVFAPARVSGGGIVLVNRGFVPETLKDGKLRTRGQIAGPAEIIGVMRWPEERGFFTPDADPAKNVFFLRDPATLAAAKNWGPVAPFYVEQEAPAAPGGYPRAGRVRPNLPNNHLQYAITWYGLALVLVVIFALWARGRTRKDA